MKENVVMIRDIPLIAFDGTLSSGKTTLIYAVASELKANGMNCVVLSEPARESPLMEDIVLHNNGTFDLPLETDLFALHMIQCVRATRVGRLIIADRTPVSTMAYTRLLIHPSNEMEQDWFLSMEQFALHWSRLYDIVFYCCDHFNIDLEQDPTRSKYVSMQQQVDDMTRKEYLKSGIELIDIPAGLTLDERKRFVLDALKSGLKLGANELF